MTTKQVGEYLGYSPSHLHKSRYQNIGPKAEIIERGGKNFIVYKKSEVIAWAEDRIQDRWKIVNACRKLAKETENASTDQAAEALELSSPSLRRLKNQPPCIRVGHIYLYPTADLAAWAEEQTRKHGRKYLLRSGVAR